MRVFLSKKLVSYIPICINRFMEKFNRQAREYFGRDEYALAVTITAPSIKQEILTEILSKFVRAKLNKYLIGTNWRKKSQAELFQIVVFPEGITVTKESHRGFFKGSFYVRPELRTKSTDCQRHYHCLIKVPKEVKNNFHYSLNLKQDIPTLTELTLNRIFLEYSKKYPERRLDLRVEQCASADLHQQHYATKNLKLDGKITDEYFFIN